MNRISLAAAHAAEGQRSDGENQSANACKVDSPVVLPPNESVVPSGIAYQPRSRISMVCWAICARVLRLVIVQLANNHFSNSRKETLAVTKSLPAAAKRKSAPLLRPAKRE
jgi:hypothetical protein